MEIQPLMETGLQMETAGLAEELGVGEALIGDGERVASFGFHGGQRETEKGERSGKRESLFCLVECLFVRSSTASHNFARPSFDLLHSSFFNLQNKLGFSDK